MGRKHTLTVPGSTPIDKEDSDMREESLHEMVASILNDSDNDVVLSNLNGLGYNNIQYNQPKSDTNSNTEAKKPSQKTKPNFANKRSESVPLAHSHHSKKDSTIHHKRKYVVE